MRLSPSQITIKSVTYSKLRSKFDNEVIEKAARSIVAAEGVINPIVVRRTGINSYELIDGHFEYYATARAKEINLAKGEMIAAYVIEEENESILKEQLEIFRRKVDDIELNNKKQNTNIESSSTNIELEKSTKKERNEFESEFEKYVTKNEFKSEFEKLENKVTKIENVLFGKTDPLQTFNKATEKQLASKLTPIFSKKGYSKTAIKLAVQIVKVREEQEFESLAEVIHKIKGIAEPTMLNIVDRWLYSQ